MSKPTRHPITTPAPTTHRGWTDYWSDETLWAIRQAIANPQPTTIEDLNMNHAVRSARITLWHAAKVLGGGYQ